MTDIEQLVTLLAVAGAVILLWRLMRRGGMVPEEEARRLHAAGARVIDVRTPAEFAGEHLSEAINVPLDAIGARIGAVSPDRATPLLLHCRSGGRSAIARMLLRRAGYTQVHNLGSYRRARRILGGLSTVPVDERPKSAGCGPVTE